MADYLNGIVYLSTENYATLKANGTLTVNGTTYTYDQNTLYITEDEETDATYIHQVRISNEGSASGSCDFVATIYSTNSNKITIDELVSTYNSTDNKLINISGIVSNSNGTSAVGNVWFANTSEAYFNNSSETCTGTVLTAVDTIIGKLI